MITTLRYHDHEARISRKWQGEKGSSIKHWDFSHKYSFVSRWIQWNKWWVMPSETDVVFPSAATYTLQLFYNITLYNITLTNLCNVYPVFFNIKWTKGFVGIYIQREISEFCSLLIMFWLSWGCTAKSTHLDHVEPVSLANHTFPWQTVSSKQFTSNGYSDTIHVNIW